MKLLNSLHFEKLKCTEKAEVLLRVSTLLLTRSRDNEACQCAEAAIQLRPTLAAAYLIAGQCYFHAKNYYQAVEKFRSG